MFEWKDRWMDGYDYLAESRNMLELNQFLNFNIEFFLLCLLLTWCILIKKVLTYYFYSIA